MAVAAAAMVGFPQAYLEGKEVKETSSLVTELCRHFYTQGWVSGTGGSITIKVHDASIPKPEQLIVMSPSGVQKERMQPEDMYILSANGSFISSPSPKPYPNKPPKCTDCAPLFMKNRRLSLGKSLRKLGYKVKLVQFEQYPTLDVLVGFFDPYNIQYVAVVAWIQSSVRTNHDWLKK